ncbi:MAG: hypothetical protein M1821_004980 [Bathelium mastoideum]|nr:MAG: hypothetical protein M1821_004980 [Bathelium mastoideum]
MASRVFNEAPYYVDGVQEDSKKGIFLPDEIIVEVLSYLRLTPRCQQSFWSCCLTSRQWYACAIPFLYERPYLYGTNFDPFVATICPSVLPRTRKSPLARHVRQLDMGNLVYQGSKSLTARILGRVKIGLVEFVAPQASFALNCFAPLSKSSNLQVLDLSLSLERVPVLSLLKCLAHLQNLEILYFPRLADTKIDILPEQWTWPPRLRGLHVINGGIPEEFLFNASGLPATLDTLSLLRCSAVTESAIWHFLDTLRSQLRVLRITRVGGSRFDCLDFILGICPNIKQLSVPVNYVTAGLFFVKHNLEFLELTSYYETYSDNGVEPMDILDAIKAGSVPKLRGVCYPRSILDRSVSIREEHSRLHHLLLGVFNGPRQNEHTLRSRQRSTTLGWMAKLNLIGGWIWDPNYDERSEVRCR